MTYLAAHCNQGGGYLHSGRNTTKPSDMQAALAAYANQDTEVGDQAIVNRSDMFELADMLDLTIVSSNVPFNDESEF